MNDLLTHYLNKILDEGHAPKGENIAARLRLLIAQRNDYRNEVEDARRKAQQEVARRIELENWISPKVEPLEPAA